MRPTDLADPGWLAATVRRHHRDLGLPHPPARVDLLDVRIRHPHRPDSRRCRGWATVRVRTGAGIADDPVFLFRTDDPGPSEVTGAPMPGLPLRVWRFPEDPGLPTLALMTQPELVRALLPADLAVARVEDVRVVRWQPGVSATVRCALAGPDGSGAVYAKLLARDDLVGVDAIQRRLHADPPDGLRVAEPIGVDTAHRILWTREVVGRKLLAGLDNDRELPLRAARLTGRSLAALHTSGLRPGRLVTPTEILTEAVKKARKITDARPQLEGAVRRLTEHVTDLSGGTFPHRPLHADFHLDQLLLTERDLVLLDLDEMATGDPALDLAELAVDLGLRRLPGATDRFLRTVRESYARAGGTPPAPAVLRGYAAAELLNRCYRHLRRPVPGWEKALDDDLGAADAVLAGAVSAVRANLEEVRT